MFFDAKITVTYNSRLKRVRAQFQVAECMKARRPPAAALEKAREKLEEELEDGQIESYEIFEKRLVNLWLHIRENAQSLAPNRMIHITLGQGARTFSEIVIKPPREAGSLADFSCNFSERKTKTIYYSAFVFHIIRQLQALEIRQKPDGAQLRFVYLLIKSGQKIDHWPIKPEPKLADHPGKTTWLELDAKQRYAALHILDQSLLLQDSQAEAVYQNARQQLELLNQAKIHLTHLQDHTVEKLKSLSQKSAAFGFGLPYSLLIAYDSDYKLQADIMHEEKKQANESASEDLPRWKMRVGALTAKKKSEYFDIGVDRNHMQATISGVHKERLEAVKTQVTVDWLIHECHKQGLVFGYDDFLDGVVEAIKKGKHLIGMTLAKALSPKAGHTVYIHESYRDQQPELGVEAVRERQNPRLARSGQLIAELRFSDGIPGRNVLGEEIHARAESAPDKIVCGEGIVSREAGRFHATRDGLIDLNGITLSCLNVYTHKGNVNLSSGNLAFDGAVIVLGDIEAGATVEVKGTLVVQGHIGPSLVKVRGNLEVQGGIVTTNRGSIVVGGSCRAPFIENSRLQVKGRLEVKTSLLNSQVVCGDQIVILDSGSGVMSGGEVSCWSAIRVSKLGMPQGQTTVCRIGSQYSAELRRQRLKGRRQVIIELKDELLQQQDFAAQPNSRKPAASKGLQNTIGTRLAKVERLLQRIVRAEEQLEKQLVSNNNASMIVTGLLDRNVEIYAAGKRIPINQSLKGILVSATPFKGAWLHDLDVWEEFHAAWPNTIKAEAS